MSTQLRTPPSPVAGTVAPGFEPVRERFAANFLRDDHCREVGAALTVFHGERCVVELWGGHADAAGHPWRADTLLNVYSTTKGIAACCVAILVDRGVLKYEDAVATVWPEFAQSGKQHVTIAQALSHQAGLPAFDAPTSIDDLYDWHARCAALAAQTPRWMPGTKTAYHPITYGYLAGELVRRASGRSIGEFLHKELAIPLEADFFIGLEPALDRRVASTLAPQNMIDPSALPAIEETRLSVTNPLLHPQSANTAEWRRAELPSLNGHASANGIARIYAMLANGGTFQRRRLLSPATIERMTQVLSDRMDLTLGMPAMWAAGVVLNGSTGFFGPNPRSYGHSGWGGSFGAADPDEQLAFGYVCNQMGPDLVGDVRARELCAAVYSCL
ncbi:MAG TPA: serine hydrolase domain-containing protein [Steroidobacteraceae bacterium]|nr:serine hydrolase domain-containing protein [Steroidobacteraceae bacterium]